MLSTLTQTFLELLNVFVQHICLIWQFRTTVSFFSVFHDEQQVAGEINVNNKQFV